MINFSMDVTFPFYLVPACSGWVVKLVLTKLFKIISGFGNKKIKVQSASLKSFHTKKQRLVAKLAENLLVLRQIFDLSSDIVFREFIINAEKTLNAALIYTDGLIDKKTISEHLMSAVMLETSALPENLHLTADNAIQVILKRLSSVTNVSTTDDMLKLVDSVTDASVALLVDGSPTAIIINSPESESRAITEPEMEPVVLGPKDGFVESISTNTTLLRRRLKSSRFKSEIFKVGAITKTKVVVYYIKGIANDKVVEEVKARIKRINIDGIIDSGYLQEFISDERYSLFPLVQSTERPDRVAAALLEGRIAILVDNSPIALIAPCTFISLMQAAEDYYIIAPFATLVRLLRFLALNIALLLPAVTVAVFSFHQGFIPPTLLKTVAGARQNLPLPIFFEVLFLDLVFELLREAGVRLPKTIGQAISTVGGLVIGDAAVNAGLVSPITVIVVALTAVASFTNPSYMAATSIRFLRFALMFLAAILGGEGIMLGLMVLLIYLSSLRSFGTPYLYPIAPLNPQDLKDVFGRVPWWAMRNRPRIFTKQDPIRQDVNQAPTKPDEGGSRDK